MRYIPSHEVKGAGIPYEGITERVPWVIGDGTLDSILKDYPELAHAERVLDIGCGNGMLLSRFAHAAKELYGIDLNDYLAVPEKDRISFAVLDLNFDRLPYADASLDVVFALQVIEHLENPFLIMREVKRVLAPGGLFILSIPNPYTLSSKLRFLKSGNVRRWTLHNDHLLFLTKDVFKKTYGTEFKFLRAYYQKGAVPLLGRLYRLIGIRPTGENTKILSRSEAFGDALCYVLRKKSDS